MTVPAFTACLDTATRKYENTIKKLKSPSVFPFTTDSGSDEWITGDWKDWRSGFFPGCLWLAYGHSQNETLLQAAKKWTASLEPAASYTETHDIGFMTYCSFGNGYTYTKDESYTKILLKASETLSKRFSPDVGMIQSWKSRDKWKYPVIIDTMMNLELLFWAWEHGGLDELQMVGETHALNSAHYHIREDGSANQGVDFDPESGESKGAFTYQGHSDDSTWSRGQAWAIYGFTMAYRYTADDEFLEIAKKSADWFVANLPNDHVPYWDFDAPNIPNEPRDSSAAAIASSALVELAGVTEGDRGNVYFDTAHRMLEQLATPDYFNIDENSPGLLLHGTGSKPQNEEIDVSLIYGDYFFLEALQRFNLIHESEDE